MQSFTLRSRKAVRRSVLCLGMPVLVLSACLSVQAAGLSPGGKGGNPADTYAAMCMQSATFPAPHGESDLKGNPKLADYCKCFGEKFLERAMKATVGAPPPLEQQQKEELAMRQSCRSQFNLPAPPKR